jgi:hypothetical protein
MDFKSACEILEIYHEGKIHDITLEFLKKRYHKMALLNHPDKRGNTSEANDKFRKINEAYNYLLREITELNNSDILNETDDESMGYINILNIFLDGLLKGKYNDFLSTIIKDIVNGYTDITLKMFEGLDKEKTLRIYNFLFKYKNILYISDEIFEKVHKIILEKHKDLQIYILNPSIKDLFENNFYKLELNNILYFVPLWHNELYFDDKSVEDGKDNIIVKCIPELPDNINIDENNNIHIVLKVPFTFSLFEEKYIVFKLGEKRFDIPLDDLKIKICQTYVFKKKGISKIFENDIYNIDDKGDVVVKLQFCE